MEDDVLTQTYITKLWQFQQNYLLFSPAEDMSETSHGVWNREWTGPGVEVDAVGIGTTGKVYFPFQDVGGSVALYYLSDLFYWHDNCGGENILDIIYSWYYFWKYFF